MESSLGKCPASYWPFTIPATASSNWSAGTAESTVENVSIMAIPSPSACAFRSTNELGHGDWKSALHQFADQEESEDRAGGTSGD